MLAWSLQSIVGQRHLRSPRQTLACRASSVRLVGAGVSSSPGKVPLAPRERARTQLGRTAVQRRAAQTVCSARTPANVGDEAIPRTCIEVIAALSSAEAVRLAKLLSCSNIASASANQSYIARSAGISIADNRRFEISQKFSDLTAPHPVDIRRHLSLISVERPVRSDVPTTDAVWLAALRTAGRSPATIASYRHAIGCLQGGAAPPNSTT